MSASSRKAGGSPPTEEASSTSGASVEIVEVWEHGKGSKTYILDEYLNNPETATPLKPRAPKETTNLKLGPGGHIKNE